MAVWTDLAPWRGPSPNKTSGGLPFDKVRGVVIHIASGFYDGTIAWQRNPEGNTSSHWIVARDGRMCQMVDTGDASWAQRSGNGTWLSIEFEGFAPEDRLYSAHPGWNVLTPQQIECAARILAKVHQVYGASRVPLQLATSPSGRGLGHHSMGAESGVDWGHSLCPGSGIKAQKAAILQRAVAIVNGGGTTAMSEWHIGGTPTGLRDDQLTQGPVGENGQPEWPYAQQRDTALSWGTYYAKMAAENSAATLALVRQLIQSAGDIDPDDLDAIEARAKAGAAKAFDEGRANLAQAVVAALPQGGGDGAGYTLDQIRDALRSVFADAGSEAND
jgi:hypothetical protein